MNSPKPMILDDRAAQLSYFNSDIVFYTYCENLTLSEQIYVPDWSVWKFEIDASGIKKELTKNNLKYLSISAEILRMHTCT